MPKRSVVATALVVSLVTVAAVSMTARQESVLNRVLPPGHVFCREMTPRCAFLSLDRAGIQAGLEDPYVRKPEQHVAQREYGGLTVRHLLDRAVATDPTYEWRDVDGIVVLRPRTAWQDAGNVLNQPTEAPLSLSNVDLGAAAFLVAGREPQTDHPTRAKLPARVFSVHVERGPLLNVLNTIVKAYGDGSWEVFSAPTGIGPMVGFTSDVRKTYVNLRRTPGQ